MGNNGERESEWSCTQCYITITSKSIKYVIDRSWCENASKSMRTLERRIKIEKQTVKVCAKNGVGANACAYLLVGKCQRTLAC